MPKKEGSESKKLEKVQPELNLGLVGHVDHGKTTLTEALSGKWTDTHSEELRKGITIRLGYADFSVYKGGGEGPEAYFLNSGSSKGAVLSRRVSIVDAPGHESLMATMLSGAAIFDGALLLIAANEECPQPQTREHLVALEIIGVKNLVVVQSKIDLVSSEKAMQNYRQIKKFLKGTGYEDSPVIPISAQRGVNLDALLQAVEDNIPTPGRDAKADPLMFVARSFDINRPGIAFEDIVGGVLGGTVKRGVLKKGDEVELRPGRMIEKKGKVSWVPVKARIDGLKVAKAGVDEVSPGGSVGVMTSLDPGIVKSDAFAGNVLGRPGALPPIRDELKLEISLLERVVGSRDDLVVDPLKPNEALMLNVNSSATVGVIVSLKKKIMTCALRLPVCAEKNSRVTISRMLGSRWRLIGHGIIK